MGQYFLAYVRKKNAKRGKAFKSTGGLKLMEHSYIGNEFMQGVCKLIYKTPSYVVWSGDYFDCTEDQEKAEMSSNDVFVDFARLWNKSVKGLSEKFDITNKFLVNHDMKVYINMRDYIDMLKCGKMIDEGWVIHPLSLLTANSNGKGGGDYWDNCLNYDQVGAWNNCLLEITDDIPKGYTDVTDDVLFDDGEE